MFDLNSKNKALMRCIYDEMWNGRNPARAVEIFAQPEGVGRFVSQFLLSFPDLQHNIEEVIAEDDRVVVRFTARGTHTGQWMHFAPTRISIQYAGVTLARIAGDKIMEQITGGGN